MEEAVERAITECIKEGILAEFLSKYRAETKSVSIYEYDEEGHMKVVREEGFQEGQASVLLPMIIKKSKRASQQS